MFVEVHNDHPWECHHQQQTITGCKAYWMITMDACVDIELSTTVAPPWFAPVQQQLNRIEASSAKVSIVNLFTESVRSHTPIYNS
jgi:hypothetical protein